MKNQQKQWIYDFNIEPTKNVQDDLMVYVSGLSASQLEKGENDKN